MNPTKVKFGDFELDVAGYELSRSGRAVKLERIPMELLLLLVDRRGQLVTRDEILEKLWDKDTFLDVDNSINTAIAKIRLVLKDDPENPAFIKTISGKGYRFIAAITSFPDGKGALGTPPDASGAPETVLGAEPAPAPKTKALLKPRKMWLAAITAVVLLAAVVAGWSWRNSLRRRVSPSRSADIGSLAVLPLENLTGDASQEY